MNGQPGAIFRDRDGKVLSAMALDVLDGQIQTIRSVVNPDKLRHLGPVADAWAVAHEAATFVGPRNDSRINQSCRDHVPRLSSGGPLDLMTNRRYAGPGSREYRAPR